MFVFMSQPNTLQRYCIFLPILKSVMETIQQVERKPGEQMVCFMVYAVMYYKPPLSARLHYMHSFTLFHKCEIALQWT